HPHALVLLLAECLEVDGVAGDPVVVDVLLVRRAADLGPAAHAVAADRALLDEVHRDLLALQLRLAEAAAEQVGGNAAVLLADFDVEAVGLAVDNAGFAPGQTRSEAECQDSQTAHRTPPRDNAATLAR